MTQQKKEIATIKERTIGVKLSDADMQRLWVKAGIVGMTPGELIATFIGDLVDGTYSNGSDERMYAEEWFDRCGFSDEAEKTFLCYLLQLGGRQLDDFLDDLDTLESSKAEKNSLNADITELDNYIWIWDKDNTKAAAQNEIKEDIERVEKEILFQQEIINKTWNEFLNWTDKKDFNQETEIKTIQAWRAFK
ncbi:MAG: molecular chaperone GrpE [Hydrogenoanaerobacterium sp.]